MGIFMEKIFDSIKKGVTIAVNEAGKLTKTVADKTTNIVDITKLNIALNDTEGNLNKEYAKMGEVVYRRFEDGAELDTELAEICAEIVEFKKEADKIKEQISELKNSVVCRECGQQNDKKSGFCSKCGAELHHESESGTVIEVTDFDEE